MIAYCQVVIICRSFTPGSCYSDGLDDRASISCKGKILSFMRSVLAGSEPLPASYPMDIGYSFQEVKAAEGYI
jgi:hypothetical protein